MAYLIFNLNDFSEIHRIAENENVLNANKNFHNEHMSIVEINDTDFLNFKKEETEFVSCDGTNVVWKTITPEPFVDAGQLDAKISFYTEHLDKWKAELRNVNKPMWPSVNEFNDYLKTLDTSTIITEGNPLESTLISYVLSQGKTAYHLFELL
tara:strand:+ start:159 stop:617 length:459 start_codon:yes stop_codon:yes gene_type:complete